MTNRHLVPGRTFARASLLAFALVTSFGQGVCRADGPPPAPPAPPANPPQPLPPPVRVGGTPAAPAAAQPAPKPDGGAPATPAPGPLGYPEESKIQRADGTVVYFYKTNFVEPAALVTTVNNLLKLPGVTLKDFPRANQVVIEGTEDAIEAALDAFAYFDVPEPQVYVEAKIIEVTYNSNFEFGLSSIMDRDEAGPNTFFRGGTTTLNPPSFFQSQFPGNLPFQGVGLAFGFVGKAAEKYGAFDLTLQALQHDGTAEILSKPSIVATQGKPASVKTGQDTPIIQITNAGLNPGGQTLTLATSFTKTEIGLDVTPKLIGDSFVTMDIEPKVDTVTGFATGQGGTSAPIISHRNAKTTVTMADGETLVIGGLLTNTTVSDKAKVPFLSEIPVLGALFTRTKEVKVKTELFFWITPHILRKKSDYRVITPPSEAERLEKRCEVPTPPSGTSGGPAR